MIDSTSIFMKFNDPFEIEKYTQLAYLEYRDRQQAYFQIQIIEVTEGSIEKTEICLQFAKNALCNCCHYQESVIFFKNAQIQR